MSSSEMYALECPVMNYAWGKIGSSSAVAQLSGQAVDEKAPYAELWMGTHHKGPAKTGGDLLSKKIGKELPYLFKVLSVAKALSIQAHPDKKLAEKLHKERPEVYKDPNHKPEMACAVTDFEAMCGFRPAEQIAEHLVSYPEFSLLVGKEIADEFLSAVKKGEEAELKSALTKLFTTVMEAKKKDVEKQVAALCESLGKLSDPSDLQKLLLRLNLQYPLDVGVFAPLFLNYLVLKPGDAMFLGANEPHAYLSGDCIECMACSDNVVRAGLTPKLRDTPTLCSMLTYKAMFPKVMKGEKLDASSIVYRCPIDEFELTKSSLAASAKYTLKSVPADALVLVYNGDGTVSSSKGSAVAYKKGSVFYVKGGEDIALEAKAETTIFRCSTASS